MIWSGAGFRLDLDRRVAVMGVLNVTPDSFADGGRWTDLDRALSHAAELVEEGADLIDIGGESTRPGAVPVPAKEEIRRVLPVISAVRARFSVPISIDTQKAEVARAALDAGAVIVNDVSALTDPAMAPLVAERDAGLVLMHMQGTPLTMQQEPHYVDVVAEVAKFLRGATDRARAAGVAAERLVVDPGIGFGKTLEHNLALIRGVPQLVELGYPVLIGASRKSFLGLITGRSAADRLAGTIAAITAAMMGGARVVRVHDVAPAVDAARVVEALAGAGA